MSASKYVVVADGEDKDGLARKTPVFSMDGRDYFHGDVFALPDTYELNMKEFQGRGLRFNYLDRWKNEENKWVEVPRTIVLPLAEGSVDNMEDPEPPTPVKKPKAAAKKTTEG